MWEILFKALPKPSGKHDARPKLISALHAALVVQGVAANLLHPDQSLIQDPMFASSKTLTHYFSIAASYYLWAALNYGVATSQTMVLPEGQQISRYSLVLLHHCTCFISYYASATLPFMQYAAQFFLLCETSTIFLNARWLTANTLNLPPIARQTVLIGAEWAFILTFISTRFLIGGMTSITWFAKCAAVLADTNTAAAFRMAAGFFLMANLTWNFLNVWWFYRALVWQSRRGSADKYDGTGCGCDIQIGNRRFRFKHIASMRSALDCDWNVFVSNASAAQSTVAQYKRAVLQRNSSMDEEDHSKITRVHGKLYDLRDFEHPGGPIALWLSFGRDSTALFEAHHPFTSRKQLAAVLNKYEYTPKKESVVAMLDDDDEEPAPYKWPTPFSGDDEDPFVVELKASVRAYFVAEAARRGVSFRAATKATPRRCAEVACIAAAFLVSAAALAQGRWWALAAAPFWAWVWVANMFHDACHFAFSADWRVNAVLPYLVPWLSSPLAWYHEHVIGHHAYPNIARRDPDLAHAPQLMREHDSVKWREAHRGQSAARRVLFVWTVAVGAGLQLLADARMFFNGHYNRVVPMAPISVARTAAHMAGRMLFVLGAFVWPWWSFAWPKALLFATLPPAVFSLLFMACSQVNHLTPAAAHANDSNYYRHQIVTAQDFSVYSPLAFYISGGLNFQIEHHLFPTVCHCHLRRLQPLVQGLCAKHGVPYVAQSSWLAALQEHLQHTEEMSTPPST
jgi:delta11-fatty-acid desaturase